MNLQKTVASLMACFFLVSVGGAQELSGLWDVEIACPGGGIAFGLELHKDAGHWRASLINGSETIEVPSVVVTDNLRSVSLGIDHYDSMVNLEFAPGPAGGSAIGTWKKRRGPKKWLTMKCSAKRHRDLELGEPDQTFLGRWAVKFDSSEDPAVGVFEKAKGSNRVLGTFMTTTGDYRYLAGHIADEKLQLSCFDGAHAFLFQATVHDDGTLIGDFWSSSYWHESWTAKRDPDAQLPDDFKQTNVTDQFDLGALSFPNLDGKLTKLNDPKFAGKARIIYVFGSWCPNCHDAGQYFSSLEKKYGPQGLSILGLAFEVTGDFERDAQQVKKYLDRHGSSYPVLVAGMADKAKASKLLPILDRVRSYPTTIFLDGKGNVKAVHTGFTGPATGASYERLKEKFEAIIAESLGG